MIAINRCILEANMWYVIRSFCVGKVRLKIETIQRKKAISLIIDLTAHLLWATLRGLVIKTALYIGSSEIGTHKHASNTTRRSPVSWEILVQYIWFEVKFSQILIANNKHIYWNAYTQPSQQRHSVFVSICLRTPGTVIGDLINICVEPQQEKTETCFQH